MTCRHAVCMSVVGGKGQYDADNATKHVGHGPPSIFWERIFDVGDNGGDECD